MSALEVLSIGPQVTVQDVGRVGHLGKGVGQGGAADKLALWEGAALLGQSERLAALEMAGSGGRFRASRDVVIALTGAPMKAEIEGVACAWNASHLLPAGAVLSLGGVQRGVYGYLHVAGGIATEPELGARGVHLLARLGRALRAGDRLPLGEGAAVPGQGLEVADRTGGGVLRVLDSLQTELFAPETLKRFYATEFVRDARANRMGVRMESGETFAAAGQLNLLSDFAIPGDIQMTGEGAPAVLLVEAQTTAGYPRLGTVLPCDLPKVAQAGQGVPIRFERISRGEALAIQRAEDARRASLVRAVRPLVRDPREIPDLLGYQLIDGVVSARPTQEAEDAPKG